MSSGLRLCLIWNKWSVRVCKTEKAIRQGEIDRWGEERERVVERTRER
jgi:hypothetical protein